MNESGTATDHGGIRIFETGATRDQDVTKHDPEGFWSPLVVERYNAYMHQHRHQSDGTLRDSDNWQKGIPLSAYMKSLWRHFLNVWKWHRGEVLDSTTAWLEDALCGVMFNAMGYLHETLKGEVSAEQTDPIGGYGHDHFDAHPDEYPDPEPVEPVNVNKYPPSDGSAGPFEPTYPLDYPESPTIHANDHALYLSHDEAYALERFIVDQGYISDYAHPKISELCDRLADFLDRADKERG